jgi:ergothioneine biosynthesis protein EgtB
MQPAYLAGSPDGTKMATTPMRFFSYDGGLTEIGQDSGDGFGFDNERPRHRVWLEPFRFASRLVTCGEFAEFMADGGYERPELWLSPGWQTVQDQGWKSPLYWRKRDGEWSVNTMRGKRNLVEVSAVPVAQVSLFEADAYARWKGLRLPTEAEWETVAAAVPVSGNLLESGRLEPAASSGTNGEYPSQMPSQIPTQIYGDCWEWTSSAYLGYPGFAPLAGSLGEYNGKFMSGQMVLRGGSCATPTAHIRASYRNFFPPETRWQFSGIRLAGS